MATRTQDIAAHASIQPDVALAFAREHGVEAWFYDHVVHKRSTLQDRIATEEPLKERELDRFDRLILLIERATDTFQNEDKALSWLQTAKRSMGSATPLEYSARERGFLQGLSKLRRITHGVYA